MSHSLAAPPIGSSDRLGLTIFFAALLHAVIILGVTFNPEAWKSRETDALSMEITLVQSHSDEAPEDADYLAQANLKGGGNVEEKMRPSSPVPNIDSESLQGDARENRPRTSPQQPVPPPSTTVMSVQQSSPNQVEQAKPQTEARLPDGIHAAQIMDASRAIAQLSAELRQRREAYAQRTREKYITANAKEYAYASYEDSWRLKVERIGNLNYPDEAKRKNLAGSLLLDVAINADGSLKGIEVLRSSGQKVLDDGAIRIVQMASPYAPFTEAMREEIDVLHIIRTWQFQNDHSLETH